MANIIATIGLNRGRVAFYDPKSNMMLDLSKPTDKVYDNMDVSGLKDALGGAIHLVHGTLSPRTVEAREQKVEQKVESAVIVPEVVKEEKVAEETVDETAEILEEVPENSTEEVSEETSEETAEETAATKKPRSRKKTN